MGREQRKTQSVEPKGDAGSVRDLASSGLQAPGRAEMVLMVIKAHTSSRFVFRVDRNQEFKFQFLLDLTHGHDLTNSAEKRIAGGCESIRQHELLREFRRAARRAGKAGSRLPGSAQDRLPPSR